MISRKPAYRMQYDDRAKAELDQRSALKDAETVGEARGRAEGEARGRAEGEAVGKLFGRIGTLEQILKLPESDAGKLSKLSLAELEKLAAKLQRKATKSS